MSVLDEYSCPIGQRPTEPSITTRDATPSGVHGLRMVENLSMLLIVKERVIVTPSGAFCQVFPLPEQILEIENRPEGAGGRIEDDFIYSLFTRSCK